MSYASEDAAAAERICASLRAAGIEVWFDQSELRGGDAWDAAIRKQIKGCALFMPVISRNAHARIEGYFRLEWKLAVDRSHLLAPDQAFLMPVVIDDTSQTDERIPDRFRELQWSRLPAGETTPQFIERVSRLLSPERAHVETAPLRAMSAPLVATAPSSSATSWRSQSALLVMAAVAVAAVGYFALERFAPAKRAAHGSTAVAEPTASSSAVSEKSIAVLPFVDLSEKHDQEYFGDGMAEEILNLLVKIPELKVIGRTSSFSFRGQQADLPSIGRALAVAYIVEGSVRRSSDRIRVTAQLIDARDGSHRWSATYDGTTTDVLRLQDEIAVRVAHSLNLEVAGQLPLRAAVKSPEAYDYYLRGLRELDENASDSNDTAREYFEKALALAPQFVPAAIEIAEADQYKCAEGVQPEVSCPRAHTSVDAALKLDPHSADAYAIRAQILIAFDRDWAGAAAAVNKAANLGGGARSKFAAARLACAIGDMARARQLLQEIMTTNPFDGDAKIDMGYFVELRSGHFELAESWVRRGLQVSPKYASGLFMLGSTLLVQGKLDEALASMRQEKIDEGQLAGLSMVYSAMGRKAESDAALNAMERNGSYFPSDFARTYAFRGDRERALNSLQKAYETHDPYLWYIKGDPLLKNLEADSRYRAFLRKMNLPD